MNYKEFFKTDNKSGWKTRPERLQKHHPEIYNNIINHCETTELNNLPFAEKVWCFIDNIKIKPVCLHCGKNVNFKDLTTGYRKFCSNKCISLSEMTLDKRKQTTLEKYGVEYYTQTSEYIEKIKKTNLEKYGVEHHASSPTVIEKVKQTNLERYGNTCSLKAENVKEKVEKTNLERYGVKNVFANEEIKQKIKETNLEKYGFEYAFQNEDVKQKFKQTNLEKYGFEYPTQNPEIREKVKQTNLERFGFEYPNQNEEIKEKTKQTNLERYGNTCSLHGKESREKTNQTFLERYGCHPLQNPKIREKLKKTNLEFYGYEYATQNPKIKEKTKQTNLEKYGVENVFANEEIKEKIKQTNIEKYGAENVFASEEIKQKIKETNLEKYGVEYVINSEELKDIIKQTNLEKYGAENVFASEEIKEKIKQTNIEKYGFPIANQNEQVRNKSKKTSLNKLLKKIENYEFINISGTNLTFKCQKGHIFDIERSLIIQRKSFNWDLCTVCNPIYTYNSQRELEINNFVKDLGIEIIDGDRKILNGKELDIYIPSKNLAIEFNGLYWHSEVYQPNDYHLQKTLSCENKNIKLIHIFEDEWLHKKDIVKSRLKNLLGLTENKIYARKCVIKEVQSKIAKEFLDKNHIQGDVNSSIKLGLYYNDELVSLMTFGGLRKALGSKALEDTYELLRFCNKLNTTVIGGANKLLQFFIKNYNPIEIISYADKRWSNGDLYEKLKFTFIHDSKPNYWYVIKDTRQHRFMYRKSVLVNEGYDPSKTEHQIMIDRGIYRIYDCGSKKYSLKLR